MMKPLFVRLLSAAVAVTSITCGNEIKATPVACLQPMMSGMCDGYFIRYYYNDVTHMCQEFVYGGCGANENNFHSLEECNHKCNA
ncbi:hypothetical protein DPMN_082846 [Dreissena polymorpha]|uniref:BPTI/Kunitz inhibitor domain-containing protein n=1 Tax=Dreissena polymorpha TaxID=45954 RepID=A0A9D3Y7P9_DREPO|nr:hypothetical protein DPMN_082846 [Dreissena polymorpha]